MSEHDEHRDPDAAIDLREDDDYEATDPYVAPPTSSGVFWDIPDGPEERRTERARGRGFLALFLAALLGAGAGAGVSYVALDGGTKGISAVRVAPPVEPGTVAGAEDAAANVAAAVLPSIVQVRTTGPFGSGGALGSGVIYTPDGYILTNDHVIAGADEIVVDLPDGTELTAALVGTARAIGVDIAVLKVVADQPLPSATFGSSRTLRVGELAVAVGSPFGLGGTVTSGIISALHRNQSLGDGVRITDAIQTDAAINTGNSGGALANSRGEVVGINTAIIGGATGGNVGVGFAIPIDIARKVADQMIAGEAPQLAFLGISGDNLPGGEGARVREVEPGSAADEAGLREGDIIVSVGGEDVGSMDELIAILITKDVGERIEIVIDRGGDRRTVTATLGARPEG